MPILIWIATVACMLEIAGVLPSSGEKHDPSRDRLLLNDPHRQTSRADE
jgi:hypothetical protein